MTDLPAELPPVLFRDARFVVLDKPAGLPVHTGPRGGASVEDWFPTLSRRKDGPWLVHRLDADTAGCLVVALRRTALLEAQIAFSGGLVHKTYWAVVQGTPAQASGTIESKLLRVSSASGWRMVSDPGGKPAETTWRLRGRDRDIGWLELFPRTGRTHQVRVHCALLGCPVLGDPIYGDTGGGDTGGGDIGGGDRGGGDPGIGNHRRSDRGGADPRLHLLARAIELPLLSPVAATAEPPAHMWAALVRCGWDPDAASDPRAGR
jgi:tRNA pseudouridine32 synthase/23S rRNA pseudouridine746 synthase